MAPTQRSRQKQRASQRAALNRPDLSRHLDAPAFPAPPPSPVRMDWPAIHSVHPTWWQVHRVELLPDGQRRYVLIAQCDSEHEAFRIADRQLSQVRITKWASRQQPWCSFRDPLRVER